MMGGCTVGATSADVVAGQPAGQGCTTISARRRSRAAISEAACTRRGGRCPLDEYRPSPQGRRIFLSLHRSETPFTRPCPIVAGNHSSHQHLTYAQKKPRRVKQGQSLMSLTTVVPSCRVLWHVARRAMLRRNCVRLSTSTPLWPG